VGVVLEVMPQTDTAVCVVLDEDVDVGVVCWRWPQIDTAVGVVCWRWPQIDTAMGVVCWRWPQTWLCVLLEVAADMAVRVAADRHGCACCVGGGCRHGCGCDVGGFDGSMCY
jgi:hypothetical protein